MNTIDYIRSSIMVSRSMTMNLINDLKDQPLAQPTTNGGNHALWILGHIAHTESSLINCLIQGQETCTLQRLKALFDFTAPPTTDADSYPSFDSLLADYEAAHKETMAYLDSITDEDLDAPAPGCPAEWKELFGTIALCLTFVAIHPTMHYGQLADTRRALGRPPLMA